jgi:hypothetical protein
MVYTDIAVDDEEAMLGGIAAWCEKLAGDPKALSTYRTELEEIDSASLAPAQEW